MAAASTGLLGPGFFGFGGSDAGLPGAAHAASARGVPGSARPRVVIVGGGAGGATLARRLALRGAGGVEVILVEPSARYTSCFFSNLRIGGLLSEEALTHDYRDLERLDGVTTARLRAVGVDRSRRRLHLSSGDHLAYDHLAYDHLVLSPGVDLAYERIPGYDREAAKVMPHAWLSGSAASTLHAQLTAMRRGGVFLIVAPPSPYRCPPAPYERASMAAYLLRERNPEARIVILDVKDGFPLSALFYEMWDREYPGMIEWIDGDVLGRIERVEAATRTVYADLDAFRGDVVSVIPPQRAGRIALDAAGIPPAATRQAAAQDDWAPVDPRTLNLLDDPHVSVIGDAAGLSPMAKSASGAVSQARFLADRLLAEFFDREKTPPRYGNVCWSALGAEDAVFAAAEYDVDEKGNLRLTAQNRSDLGESPADRRRAAKRAQAWHRGVVADMFGSSA